MRSFLFQENDLSGTKWGAQSVLYRLKRFRGTKCLRLKVLFHVSVFPERNRRGDGYRATETSGVMPAAAPLMDNIIINL